VVIKALLNSRRGNHVRSVKISLSAGIPRNYARETEPRQGISIQLRVHEPEPGTCGDWRPKDQKIHVAYISLTRRNSDIQSQKSAVT